jgi:hypothetical protein
MVLEEMFYEVSHEDKTSAFEDNMSGMSSCRSLARFESFQIFKNFEEQVF